MSVHAERLVQSALVQSKPMDAASAQAESGALLTVGLNASLHAMSQPMTALLCMLEFAARLEATEEVKGIIAGGLEQCGRLMECVRAMQTQVQQAQVPVTPVLQMRDRREPERLQQGG